jgi:leucyl/phenylalanyl-tRNA--protein transferase
MHTPLENIVEALLAAYRAGIFPMADPETGEISWYRPDPRAIVPLDEHFRVPRSVVRVLRRHPFELASDRDFEGVMRACAAPRPDDHQSWIDERLIVAYTALHDAGHAHSVEAWLDGRLVGGLYGVHVGGAFCGESMFVRPELGGTDASKVCLVHLVAHLRRRGFVLLDTQFMTEHLRRFGTVEIAGAAYLERLAAAVDLPVTWGVFAP